MIETQRLLYCILVFTLALIARVTQADTVKHKTTPAVVKASPLETLESPAWPGAPVATDERAKRGLASGDPQKDLEHYNDLSRKLGIDLGMMIPMGEFQSEFANAPSLGLHFAWEAIAPFSFIVSTARSSASHKNGAAFGKLTTAYIGLGTQATFPTGRFLPFVKAEGAFHFNDVSFDSNRTVTTGNDTFVSTIGINTGLGWDYIVGRELSFGLEGTYHYAVPKKLTLSNGTSFDIGSSYVTVAFRVNF